MDFRRREHIDAFIETYNQHAKPSVWTKARVHQKRIKVRFAEQWFQVLAPKSTALRTSRATTLTPCRLF